MKDQATCADFACPQQLPSFSGHETFVLRYGWLKKAVDHVRDEPRAFRLPDAVVRLGVGKNMVRSIRHWALATGVLAEAPGTRGAELVVTPSGEMIFGKHGADKYLEDHTTLWILHWFIVTNKARCTTWSWAFNYLTGSDFTAEGLVALIRDQIQRRRLKPPSDKTLRRDVECFLRSYVAERHAQSVLEDSLDCPLAELGLIEQLDGGRRFRFARGRQKTLSNEIFAFAVAAFWANKPGHTHTLAFADVAYGADSPGTVFKVDEDSLSARLEDLELCTAGRIWYGEGAGFRQLYRRPGYSLMELLKAAYAPLRGKRQ